MRLMEKIRVLIVDDHPLFRQGVRHTLEATKDIEVIGEAPDGQRAIQMAEALAPDLMLIDINLPGLNGLEVTRVVRRRQPQIAVIILIFLITTCGWIILGTSIAMRSDSADSGLSRGVQSNWGSAQQQSPPSAIATHVEPRTQLESVNGVTTKKVSNETVSTPLQVEQSRIRVGLDRELNGFAQAAA